MISKTYSKMSVGKMVRVHVCRSQPGKFGMTFAAVHEVLRLTFHVSWRVWFLEVRGVPVRIL